MNKKKKASDAIRSLEALNLGIRIWRKSSIEALDRTSPVTKNFIKIVKKKRKKKFDAMASINLEKINAQINWYNDIKTLLLNCKKRNLLCQKLLIKVIKLHFANSTKKITIFSLPAVFSNYWCAAFEENSTP